MLDDDALTAPTIVGADAALKKPFNVALLGTTIEGILAPVVSQFENDDS